MSFDREHLLVSWKFGIPVTDEIAITTLKLSNSVPGWSASAALAELAPLTAVGDVLLDALADLQENANLFWADYSQLQSVRIVSVNEAGAEDMDALERPIGSARAGTAGGTLPQSSVVMSLRSGSSIGSANFGRMFLPHTRLGMVASTPASNLATVAIVNAAFRGFLNIVTAAINGAVSIDVQPFIMSNQAPKPSKPVAEVQVGTVTDTQRRRRNALVEQYSVLPLP